MTIHYYSDRSYMAAGKEWTSHTSACKPRGTVNKGGHALLYRVTYDRQAVSCKACLREMADIEASR